MRNIMIITALLISVAVQGQFSGKVNQTVTYDEVTGEFSSYGHFNMNITVDINGRYLRAKIYGSKRVLSFDFEIIGNEYSEEEGVLILSLKGDEGKTAFISISDDGDFMYAENGFIHPYTKGVSFKYQMIGELTN